MAGFAKLESNLPRIRLGLIGLFIIALIFFLDFAREFLLPVVLAFFIALTFRPSIRILARHHIPPWLAASGFITLVVAAAAVMLLMLAGPIQALITDAPSYSRIFSEKIRTLRVVVNTVINVAERMQEAASMPGQPGVQPVVIKDTPLFSFAGQVTGYSVGAISTLVLTLVIAAFLMASGDLFYAKLVRVLPTLADKKTALKIVYDVEREVSAYLLIVTAINAALGLAVAGSFYALGMPTPLLWGVVAFVLNYIPYAGAICGFGLTGFMAIVTFDSLGYALLVPLSYAFWNGVENQFVTPLLLGRRLQLNAVAILLALAFWTWIWGIAGTIIAVPVLVAVKVFCDHLDNLAGIGEFLSEKYPDDNGSVAKPVSDTPATAGQLQP
jgi:predicted PurR-regulated permease PerM